MALLEDPLPRLASTSLIRLASLLLLLTWGASTTASADDSVKVHLWINGTAALWRLFASNSQICDSLLLDSFDHKPLLYDCYATPHTGPNFEIRDRYPLRSDGIGIDIDVYYNDSYISASEFRDKIIGSSLPNLNNLVYDTFRQRVKAFPTLPTTELFVDNATIAISQPVELWELYLNISKSLIPKQSVFQVPDEVLRYMPMDLQNALRADQSHYQIMPTSMWTNSTDTYINYTVYAAPTDRIPDTLRLTAKQVRDRLLGSTLPRFGSELANFIKNSGQSSKFKDLLWLPVVLRAHLPPNPHPPTPYEVVSKVTARFVIRFSGNQSNWERVLEGDSTALNDSIRTSAKAALDRRLYVTEVSITRFKPVKDGGRRTEGLLAYGEARQDRTVMAQHPWDARDIISVLSKGDYSAALALCTGGQAPAKLIAVGLDADFGDVTTVHYLVMIGIVICFAAGTILAVLLHLVILHFFTQKEVIMELWDEDGEVTPDLSCYKFSLGHFDNATSLPQPEALGEQQFPERITNPLGTTYSPMAEVSEGTLCSF